VEYRVSLQQEVDEMVRNVKFCIFFIEKQPLLGKNVCFFLREQGATNNFLLLQPKLCCSIKRFVDRTKHFVVVTKYFCCPYFNK